MKSRTARALAAAAASLALAAPFAGPRPAAARDMEPDAGLNPWKIELGRRLFFDPAISHSGDTACASCHLPDHAFSSPLAKAEDDFLPSKRHAPTLVDAASLERLNWDGHSSNLEILVWSRLGAPSPAAYRMAPFLVPPPPNGGRSALDESSAVIRDGFGRLRVLDVRTLEPVGLAVQEDGRYASLFMKVFESPFISTPKIVGAVSEFVRSIRHTTSPYDRWRSGDRDALSPEARRGMDLFLGRARCTLCHWVSEGPAPFTDGDFHNVGVEWASRIREAPRAVSDAPGRIGRGATGSEPWTPLRGHKGGLPGEEHSFDDGREDIGRRLFDGGPKDLRAFKTPTLRDVALRGPYMHDGSLTTLEAVVRYFAGGGAPDPYRDPMLEPVAMTDSDVLDLVAFLRSLSGSTRPAAAPDFALRAKTTRIRIIDAGGRPLAGLKIGVVPAGDVLPGDSPETSATRELVTDAEGRIEFAPPRRTHARLALPDGLRARQGELIPDTCERLTLTIPVRGRAHVALFLGKGAAAPQRLTALISPRPEQERKVDVVDAPWSHPATRVLFTLDRVEDLAGMPLARYSAWVHAEAPETGLLEALGADGTVWKVVSLKDGAETKVDLTAR